MDSVTGTRQFDLWLQRRKFIDDKLASVRKNREAAPEPDGLEAILHEVLADADHPLPDLDAHLIGLTSSGTADEMKAARKGVAALSPTVESFTRLMAIGAKDRLAQQKDPSSLTPLNAATLTRSDETALRLSMRALLRSFIRTASRTRGTVANATPVVSSSAYLERGFPRSEILCTRNLLAR